MAESFTEIVMLSMRSEPHFLPEWLGARQGDPTESVRCGPPNALRPCSPDEPALRQMARACAAHGGEPTVAPLFWAAACLWGLRKPCHQDW